MSALALSSSHGKTSKTGVDITTTPIHRFSEFASNGGRLEGKKKKIPDILNQDIIVKAFSVKPSKYESNYLTIQFEQNGELFIVFTGSTILTEQLKENEDKLPFVAQIKEFSSGERRGKYYSFV